MNQLRIDHLRYVQQVAATGSFTAAARMCGVSQPTVSESIASVEGALGARLFVRTTRSVTPTPFGAELMPWVDAVVAAADGLDAHAATLREPEVRRVRIGFASVVDLRRLHALVAPFRAARPDVELIYKECTSDDLEARLAASACDVAIRVRTRRGRGSFVLYRDRLRFLPRGGGSAGAASIDLAAIARSPLVFTVGNCGLAPTTRALFREAGIEVTEVAGQALSYAALEEWSDLGIGAAILPESRLARDPRSLPVVEVDGRPAELVIEAATNPDAVRPDHVDQLVRTLRGASR